MKDNVLEEIIRVVKEIGEREYKLLASLIGKAERVFVTGAGRSGLIGRCFAMRLRHLGIESYVPGETICPPIRKGDILIVISSSGRKKTVIAMAETGEKEGAKVLSITSKKTSPLTNISDYKIIIPAKNSIQFGDSLFEQAALIFLDTFVEWLRKEKRISHSDMLKRHTNLE
ncbi:MAG TPA: SIS domain-containing protein [bacterium]|nr:SIS domain-containing protein [bacterium]